jgi:hypothetical protein
MNLYIQHLREQAMIDLIKSFVDQGATVYAASDAYKVIKAKEYLIKCSFNGYCVGLHGRAGTKYATSLNGTSFYIKEATQ